MKFSLNEICKSLLNANFIQLNFMCFIKSLKHFLPFIFVIDNDHALQYWLFQIFLFLQSLGDILHKNFQYMSFFFDIITRNFTLLCILPFCDVCIFPAYHMALLVWKRGMKHLVLYIFEYQGSMMKMKIKSLNS